MEYELDTYRGNPQASEAMEIAADLRREGYDAASALQEGWRQVKGGNSNPVGELIEAVNPFGSKGTGGLLLILAVAYAIWAAIRKSWTPWAGLSLGKPNMALLQAQARARAKAQQPTTDISVSLTGYQQTSPGGPGMEPTGIISV